MFYFTDLCWNTGNMSLKFCANLSFMFQECTLILDRYGLAKQCGFKGVECAFLYSYPVEQVVQAKKESGLEQILINVNPGDLEKGELGFAAIPGKEDVFRDSLQQAIDYCKALECKLIHIMAGKVPNPTEENDRVYKQNLTLAAEMLKDQNLVGVVEAINSVSIPGYYLNDFQKALDVVKKINSPHIKVLADLFHFQMMKADLQKSITEAYPYIGHVQVAQAPNRNEPDTLGEIDYKHVFSLLESLGYDGWIGLEYKPASDTKTGLKWIETFGFTL